jgi:hypothetical protein
MDVGSDGEHKEGLPVRVGVRGLPDALNYGLYVHGHRAAQRCTT